MISTNQIKLDDWVLSLCLSPETSSVFASTSKGSLYQLPLDATKWQSSAISNSNAHNSQINKILTDPNSTTTLYSCSDDSTVKVWDIRSSINKPIYSLTNSRNLPFFSMDVRYGLISAGSQLKGTDSELVLWDTKKLDTPLRSFIDSHNDDITETKFHPTRSNILISGSTDGNLNVYDLNITEEDDAQLQCINYNSVHSAGFLNPDRLYILSHMETFSLFDLSKKYEIDPETYKPDKPEEKTSKQDKDFGDIREKWDCEYVIDLYAPNYIACGSNSKKSLNIFQFDINEEVFDPSTSKFSWTLEGAHDEEIVRDISIYNNLIYSGGEDNIVRVWNGESIENTERCFFTSEDTGDKSDIVENDTLEESEERMDVEYDVEKVKSKEKKKHRKQKKDSKSKKHRFKPY